MKALIAHYHKKNSKIFDLLSYLNVHHEILLVNKCIWTFSEKYL